MLLKRWISDEDLIQAMTDRAAIKKFDPTKVVPEKTIDALLECCRLTASSGGLQPWKFVLVTNKEIMAKMQEVVKTKMTILPDASHIIVICKMTDISKEYVYQYADILAARWNLPSIGDALCDLVYEKTFVERASWLEDQTYIVLGQIMACCAVLGIDCLPMEEGDHRVWDKLLGLTDSGYTSILAAVLGYRNEADYFSNLPKERKPMDELLIRVK
jgi:nitroreductase